MGHLVSIPSLTRDEAERYAPVRDQARCYAVRWHDDEGYRRPLRVLARSEQEVRLHVEDLLGRTDFEIYPL